MPPRRQSAPKPESKAGLVVALVFFILLTIVLGVTTYLGYSGQDAFKAETAKAKEEKDKSDKSAQEFRARWQAHLVASGAPAPEVVKADDLPSLRSNTVFAEEIARVFTAFSAYGVNWGAPNTDTPVESMLVVCKRLTEQKAAADRNAEAAIKKAEQQKQEYIDKLNTEIAARKQAESEQARLAKVAEDAQKAEQVAKTFGSDKINELAAQKKKADEDAKNREAALEVEKKAALEKVAGNAATIEKLTSQQTGSRQQIFITDRSHGVVQKVDSVAGTAFIKLGSADFVRPGMSFSVLQSYDASQFKADEPLPKKATLTVTKVMGEHLSQASIKYGDYVNAIQDPVRTLDQLYKPGWKPGDPARWALAGHFDLNGLGRDETRLLADRLKKQGIVIDAYLDLNTLKVVGELHHGIDYLIIGNRPTGETARVIGEDRKKEIEDAINAMQTKAQNMAIVIMQHRTFLPLMGVELPRNQHLPYFPGGGAGGAPTGGEKPKANTPKEEEK